MAPDNTPQDTANRDDATEPGDFTPSPLLPAHGEPPESAAGLRVQAARNHYRLSVEALSRLTKAYDTHEGRGISSTALLRYEAGEAQPGARELRLLCQALGIPPEWLLLGTLSEAKGIAEELAFAAAFATLQAKIQNQGFMGDGVTYALRYEEQIQRRQRIAEARRRP